MKTIDNHNLAGCIVNNPLVKDILNKNILEINLRLISDKLLFSEPTALQGPREVLEVNQTQGNF